MLQEKMQLDVNKLLHNSTLQNKAKSFLQVQI